MRIIAGTFRGRKLLPPATDATRPVTDRVKQSTFDILAPLLDGATVYDCFAGTGSMGLECLSRGAAAVTFFESHRPAVDRLRQNIAAVGVGERSGVVIGDLFAWFADPDRTVPQQVDLIFLDPPYRHLTDRADALRALAGHLAHHLAPDGVVVFRHDAADALALPGLPASDVRTYGGMAVEFLRPAVADRNRMG